MGLSMFDPETADFLHPSAWGSERDRGSSHGTRSQGLVSLGVGQPTMRGRIVFLLG